MENENDDLTKEGNFVWAKLSGSISKRKFHDFIRLFYRSSVLARTDRVRRSGTQIKKRYYRGEIFRFKRLCPGQARSIKSLQTRRKTNARQKTKKGLEYSLLVLNQTLIKYDCLIDTFDCILETQYNEFY